MQKYSVGVQIFGFKLEMTKKAGVALSIVIQIQEM